MALLSSSISESNPTPTALFMSSVPRYAGIMKRKSLPRSKSYPLKLLAKNLSYSRTANISLTHMSLSTTSEIFCSLVDRTILGYEVLYSWTVQNHHLSPSQYLIFLKCSLQFVTSLPAKAACSDRSKSTEQGIFCLEKATIFPNHSTNQITQLKIF